MRMRRSDADECERRPSRYLLSQGEGRRGPPRAQPPFASRRSFTSAMNALHNLASRLRYIYDTGLLEFHKDRFGLCPSVWSRVHLNRYLYSYGTISACLAGGLLVGSLSWSRDGPANATGFTPPLIHGTKRFQRLFRDRKLLAEYWKIPTRRPGRRPKTAPAPIPPGPCGRRKEENYDL
ncbi:hypothetical protein EVAR_56943_1 [Eumeta japonica]|uniref:Uncharacterized protein n=1 Tax=Eumeta variegata TaxID=151549 RepID=A0A4C1YS03_EUMVA|nr:hypothetical protein EVAR_56943_1 [Eumeta japonica]